MQGEARWLLSKMWRRRSPATDPGDARLSSGPFSWVQPWLLRRSYIHRLFLQRVQAPKRGGRLIRRLADSRLNLPRRYVVETRWLRSWIERLTVQTRASAAWDAAYPTISGRVISDCPRQTPLPRPGFVGRQEIVIRGCAADSKPHRKSSILKTKMVGGPGFEPGASRSRNLRGFVH